MLTADIKTNPDLDKAFAEICKRLKRMPTPKNFCNIYDFANRFQNKYGFGPRFIVMVYLLGYIDGRKNIKI